MLLINNGQKSGGIFSKYIRFSNMVINSNLNSCFHFHLYLPLRILRFSGFILRLLLNSGPLKSSLSSFSTGSGCTVTVPRIISFQKPLHVLNVQEKYKTSVQIKPTLLVPSFVSLKLSILI